MSFFRVVRSGDWALHFEALEVFTKYFFAHDMLNYPCRIPVYLVEMQISYELDPERIRMYHSVQLVLIMPWSMLTVQ